MLAERRAAEVQNQPGPHVQRAIAALQRAEKREWSPGEPRLFAEMLGHLGGISQKPLADEVLRVMAALHAAEKEGTLDRLRIARWLAESLNNNGRREQAIAVLEAAIPEYRRTKDGKTTSELVEPVALLSDLYAGGGPVRAGRGSAASGSAAGGEPERGQRSDLADLFGPQSRAGARRHDVAGQRPGAVSRPCRPSCNRRRRPRPISGSGGGWSMS